MEKEEKVRFGDVSTLYLEPAAELLSGGVVRFLTIRILTGFYGIKYL